jgi:hypothetical protein
MFGQGIEVVPDPRPSDPGHARLPQLRTENRRDAETDRLKGILGRLASKNVAGPFATPEA